MEWNNNKNINPDKVLPTSQTKPVLNYEPEKFKLIAHQKPTFTINLVLLSLASNLLQEKAADEIFRTEKNFVFLPGIIKIWQGFKE